MGLHNCVLFSIIAFCTDASLEFKLCHLARWCKLLNWLNSTVYYIAIINITSFFAILLKVTVSFVMSVCPSVRPHKKSGFHERICMKFEIWFFFLKSVGKIYVSLKSDRNNGHFTWIPVYICDNISLSSSYSEKHFRKKAVEKIKTHYVFHNFLQKSCCFKR